MRCCWAFSSISTCRAAAAGIPGSVGGTPIQNVGAYGQEVSEVIVSIEVIDLDLQTSKVITNKECDFSKDEDHLPITVIDESIYKDPPTLLIGTIDKFASLSWLSDAISMFDKEGLTKPDLIIQDELHLILPYNQNLPFSQGHQ